MSDLYSDNSGRLIYKINKMKAFLGELEDPKAAQSTISDKKMIRVTYRSYLYLPIMFVLLGLTILPIQFHLRNFDLQILKMNDSCSDSTALIFNTLNANQTMLFNKLFPYGLPNSNRLEKFLKDIHILDELYTKQSLNNLTIKYLSESECMAKNYTKYLNMITISSARILNSVKKQLYYRIPYSNRILICDDDLYKKSLINSARRTRSELEYQMLDELLQDEDFQTNVLVKWNITCENLHSSIVTIAYAQMSFLSGKIIGAIFLSIMADYIGRKNIYLITLYVSGIVGSLVSMVHTYRLFLAVRFVIAALVQGCFVVAYVLLFETIISPNSRNFYSIAFVSLEPFMNIFVSLMTKYINDWRYLQLTGSLLASVAFVYPWMIKESFKWLLIRGEFKKAQSICYKILQVSNGSSFNLAHIKSLDKFSNDKLDIESFQPTLRRIIKNFHFTDDMLTSEISVNFIVGIFNLILSLIILNLGKRIPLSMTVFLGSLFYLSSLIISSQHPIMEIIKLILNIFAKVMLSCSTNVLILFVCELFPCEIRCSSLSFFLSIKHLSEMLSIYVFKISSLPSPGVKMFLGVMCTLLCILPFLLPEQTSYSFNLSDCETSKDTKTCSNSLCTNTLKSNQLILNISEIKSNDIIVEQTNNYLSYDDSLTNEEIDPEESIFAKDIIEKINSENISKSGKLNPLYEEDSVYVKNRSPKNVYDLEQNRIPYGSLNDEMVQKFYLMKQGSTKF
ncbi:organic cation transporter [Brachionus plicatilis]|uniref:Organic cation transporter n=1 Tax=Brachionus plicatilis TaxID=10195 RepID=A0A3M7S563_BRAPC|nr:organic cation transporter [Brachionus plicatilis]